MLFVPSCTLYTHNLYNLSSAEPGDRTRTRAHFVCCGRCAIICVFVFGAYRIQRTRIGKHKHAARRAKLHGLVSNADDRFEDLDNLSMNMYTMFVHKYSINYISPMCVVVIIRRLGEWLVISSEHANNVEHAIESTRW